MQPGSLPLLMPSPETAGVPPVGPVPTGPAVQQPEAGDAPPFAALLGLLRRALPGEGEGVPPEASRGALLPGLLPGGGAPEPPEGSQAHGGGPQGAGPEDGAGAGLAAPAAELLQRLLQALREEGGGAAGEVPAGSGPAGSEGGRSGPARSHLEALRAWLAAALAASSREGPPPAAGAAAEPLVGEGPEGPGATPHPGATSQVTVPRASQALDPVQAQELERLLRRLGLAGAGTSTGEPLPPTPPAGVAGRPAPAAAAAGVTAAGQPAPPLLQGAPEALPLGTAPGSGAGEPAHLGTSPLPQAPPLGLPPRHPAWGTELGQRVLWMVRQEVQAAEIRLHPPHLGPLEARVSLVHDQVSVTFVAQHAQVREALDAALPRLRELLGDHGLQLADASVAEHGLADRGREGPGGSGQAGARDGATEGEGGAGSLREAEGPAQARKAREAAGWRPRLVDRYV